MSTVLSNGVIVPDVGSTNWASDLETNWTLLNALIGAVGSNVRLDRPNIWTAAQTFSEGIYGDLAGTAAMAVSDANGNEIATTYALQTDVTALQTAVGTKAADSAVVHKAGTETITGNKTFTGSTVTHNITPETDKSYSLGTTSKRWTDLYVSKNIGIYEQGLTFGTAPTAATYFGLRYYDNTGNLFGDLQFTAHSNGSNYSRIRCRNTNGTDTYDRMVQLYVKTDGTTQFIPNNSGVTELGTSSYNWKSVYAQTYYYNGTEFSDKFWTADTVQSFTVSKHLKAVNLKVGQGESYGRTGYSLVWTDKNDVPVGYIDSYKNANAARTVLRIRAGDYYTNGTLDSEGTQIVASLRVGTLANSTKVIEAEADAVYPTTNAATDLGTSDNKWKTFNGINPGALSFPQAGATANTDYIDVSGSIDLTTTASQTLTAPATGWLCLSFSYNKITYCQLSAGSYRSQTGPLGTSGFVGCVVPVTAGQSATIRVDATAIYSARLYLCQGNV